MAGLQTTATPVTRSASARARTVLNGGGMPWVTRSVTASVRQGGLRFSGTAVGNAGPDTRFITSPPSRRLPPS